jgi:hypothetical protein
MQHYDKQGYVKEDKGSQGRKEEDSGNRWKNPDNQE